MQQLRFIQDTKTDRFISLDSKQWNNLWCIRRL